MTAILGISAFYHDSAAALLVDGQIIAAAQEERFSRIKHDDEFPSQAVEYCLAEAGLAPDQLDYVGFYDKPLLKFDRLLETYLAYAPAGYRSFAKAMPVWLKKKLYLPREMRQALNGYRRRFVFTDHHESHAASAFFPSPYEEAAILTLDGVGEWATATCGAGRGNRIELTQELRFPHSPGLLYSAFTYYCGFEVNSGEYKLMGLAPYGEPHYVDHILDQLIDLRDDGSFRMDMSFFNFCQGLTMTSKRFDQLFGDPPRQPGAELTQRDMDLAASVQKVTEEIMLRMARHVHAQTGLDNLCLAGGVALNCVGNGRLQREGPFENLWIQPAAGDAGGALGTAQFIWHQLLGNERLPRPGDGQQGSRLGQGYSDEEIEAFLESTGAVYQRIEITEDLLDHVSTAIAEGQAVGWFQDRMEYGPRALGSRSILGDARNPDMQALINQKVKFREGFRPFAPIVLAEHAHKYFSLAPDQESPYMLIVTPVHPSKRVEVPADLVGATGLDRLRQVRSEIPAVTHVDDSARIQTVDPGRHGRLHSLITRFHQRTGCPVMVNTSFNLGWEPIVRSPEEAYRTFMSCELDLLCIGHCVLEKSNQPATVHQVVDNTSDEVFDGLLASPCCAATLVRHETSLQCTECSHHFEIDDGIPQLFWPHDSIDDPTDVTHGVREFYEETPFPNYDDHDSVRSLIDKSRRGLYARRLDESLPYNADVLEVGCGTGQLSNYLGISCRRIIGVDLCLNSLRLGEAFRRQHGLVRVRFLQMNLFRPAFARESFDVVLCNGVLHHTADPLGGFESLVSLLKPGGHLVMGLYNRYSRLFTDLRRQVFRLTGGRMRWIDPILRRGGSSQGKRTAWFADQYQHPHESKHTFDETLSWLDQTGLSFVRGIPAMRPQDDGLAEGNLLQAQPRGTALERLVVQMTQVFAGQKEGGFYLIIARKPETASTIESPQLT